MWEDIVALFANMPWFSYVLLGVGIFLMIIEIFNPGFGVFGVLGILAISAGIISRVAWQGLSVAVAFKYALIMIGLLIIILFLCFIIMVYSAKHGLLKKSALIQMGTALPVKREKKTASDDYSKLINKKGITQTDLKPVGKALINGKVYEVIADGTYIYQNIEIRVIRIEGSKIICEEIN